MRWFFFIRISDLISVSKPENEDMPGSDPKLRNDIDVIPEEFGGSTE